MVKMEMSTPALSSQCKIILSIRETLTPFCGCALALGCRIKASYLPVIEVDEQFKSDGLHNLHGPSFAEVAWQQRPSQCLVCLQ